MLANMPLIIEGSQPVIITETVEQRKEVIEDCQELYKKYEDAIVELDSEYHKKYLDYAFNNKLPPQMKALDPSQPWILYWVANGLRTMNESWLEEDYQSRIQEKLFASSTTCGPFGGGYGQLPHLASNYAGIEALLLCNNAAACWDRINKKAIYDWFLSLKVPNGGFKTALTVGEVDARGVYTALSVASLLGLLTDELIEGCTEFIVGCQTYEGGFGSCPQEDEAHGGYTFCAVASLAILNGLDSIDIPKLMKWCSARQFNEEKGFSGRTNKLVDGCYSFWVGGTAAILEAYGYGECIDKESLQEYILKCCQPDDRPGLRDKPGKPPDYYHTNYVLLGLAVAQYSFICTGTATTIECSPIVSDPAVSPINPVYGLPTKDIDLFRDYLKMNT